jgi:L-alanine-DL-glutamate epimerase-like enolase superfamily enzyme
VRISAIETVLRDDHPHVVHVLIHTDEGVTGLGESFHHPESISEYVHTSIAPLIVGQPATNIANVWQLMGNVHDGRQPHAGMISIESSATSAVDIAMWDLRAKAFGVPLYDALGGRVRDQIRVYNTCAQAGHLPPPGTPRHERQRYWDWGIGGAPNDRYDDWTATLERPAALARDLVDSGLTAMKIFPFSRVREAHVPRSQQARRPGTAEDVDRLSQMRARISGLSIPRDELEENVAIFRAIRQEVGDEIDVAVDLGSRWTFGPAVQIATALEPFNLLWLEDVMRLSSIDALARLASLVKTPLAGFDYRAGLPAYAELINSGAVSIVRMDVQWVGGVSEVCRVAGYAEARNLGFVLHDCTGPVQWAASIHACLHLRNAMLQESVRAYYLNVYPNMVAGLPEVAEGHARPADRPGHGVELRAEYLEGARRRQTRIDGNDWIDERLA